MEFTGTNVLRRMQQSEKRVLVLEGGMRSSKTTSIWQFLFIEILKAANRKEKITITIIREKLIWAKSTVIKDFFKWVEEYNLPISPEPNPRRQEQTYEIYGCEIAFFGADEYGKFQGREQDIVWLNEAMQISYQVYKQLSDRTKKRVILDYNPNATEHWIYDKVIPAKNAEFIHSTMLDNPFLDEEIVQSILQSEPTPDNIAAGTADETHWKIYGLGERAELKGLIYTNVRYIEEFPKDCKWVCYGLDFGFSQDSTALIKVGMVNGELYFEELLYQTGLTNLPPYGKPEQEKTSIHYFLGELGLSRRDEIVADSAEQKSISELRSAGWNMLAAQKGAGTVNLGIGILQKYRINAVETGSNLRKELTNYKWQVSEGGVDWTQEDNRKKNKPVDRFNHLLDAARYVAYYKLRGQEGGGIRISF